ncbi:XRE family transcriptional regulator [Duganella sp. BJB488]|uniref:helix-turn-helix domain-containing protein n=1 Tax=unclassified Duganella TaxID=2636909 RepID=UPI000E3472FE|nr:MULTISPECIES: helix-turn-helix domain-containing protein [unclassified Duganella]NVD74354.1 XRE family transcriptional regulator [Duganella sp. BJB1802]RFP10484.1 XRE family transcriptional regulator [Duganella sp. BJB489]RFP14256.1 XRE family transcriptional regulator [Duganella sp. BJB488]RFP30193.1 XRE family transcriptional regulator [Duganella sp. BJB480]
MTANRFTSVWDAIEDAPEEAENMKVRSQLMMQLKSYITKSGLSQSEAARIFGITQPRVSDLMRGKINLFGIDALVNMAAKAGLHVEIRLRETA